MKPSALRSHRLWFLLLVLGLPFSAGPQDISAQQTCGCGLGHKGPEYLRHISWRIHTDTTVPLAGFENVVNAAAKVWNDEFTRRGRSASMSKGPDDIRIFVTDQLASGGQWDPATKILRIAASDWMDPEAPADYILALLIHEMGHAFGFEQGGCEGESVMSNTNRSSFRTKFTYCDNLNFNQIVGKPQGRRDNDDDYYSPDDAPGSEYWEDECADYDANATTCSYGGGEEYDEGPEADPREYEGGYCTIEWTVYFVRYWNSNTGSWGPWQEYHRTVDWTDCPPWYY
jgi:hypothetical protein